MRACFPRSIPSPSSLMVGGFGIVSVEPLYFPMFSQGQSMMPRLGLQLVGTTSQGVLTA